jgi:hypothetical protein
MYYKCTLDIHVSENRRENEELTIQNHRKSKAQDTILSQTAKNYKD